MFQPKNSLDLSKKPLIGMVHLPPLDVSLHTAQSLENISKTSLQDAITLETAGFDAVLIENFHDTPYTKYRLDDFKFLLFSSIVEKIVSQVGIPCGVNILRNACVQAFILATINRGSFIRCNIYEGAYVTDQGIIESVAAEVQQKMREIKSNVKILADIHVKHATPLGDFSMEESAANVINREGATAIILSGRATGRLIDKNKLKNFVHSTKIKPILGSGLTIKNLPDIFPYISGAIVGSSIKVTDISSPIDMGKAKALAQEWKHHRQSEKGDKL
ncbi:MAG: BtpA/SgcQ family protein [Candidatus Heimdallarchaeota archaeon]|nr:MAG: BtpA/SgcQ family protein [Candidatus Heimdallarchaeota archaeon]